MNIFIRAVVDVVAFFSSHKWFFCAFVNQTTYNHKSQNCNQYVYVKNENMRGGERKPRRTKSMEINQTIKSLNEVNIEWWIREHTLIYLLLSCAQSISEFLPSSVARNSGLEVKPSELLARIITLVIGDDCITTRWYPFERGKFQVSGFYIIS